MKLTLFTTFSLFASSLADRYSLAARYDAPAEWKDPYGSAPKGSFTVVIGIEGGGDASSKVRVFYQRETGWSSNSWGATCGEDHNDGRIWTSYKVKAIPEAFFVYPGNQCTRFYKGKGEQFDHTHVQYKGKDYDTNNAKECRDVEIGALYKHKRCVIPL
jgi:hypothetical protein